MPQTLEAQLFSRWIAYLEAYDIEGMLGQYHDQAIMIFVDQVINGKDKIARFLRSTEILSDGLTLSQIEQYTRLSDLIVVQTAFQARHQARRMHGVMVLREGKILYHIITLLKGC